MRWSSFRSFRETSNRGTAIGVNFKQHSWIGPLTGSRLLSPSNATVNFASPGEGWKSFFPPTLGLSARRRRALMNCNRADSIRGPSVGGRGRRREEIIGCGVFRVPAPRLCGIVCVDQKIGAALGRSLWPRRSVVLVLRGLERANLAPFGSGRQDEYFAARRASGRRRGG